MKSVSCPRNEDRSVWLFFRCLFFCFASVQRSADEELAGKQTALEHRRKAIEAQIEALRAGFLADEEELTRGIANARRRTEQVTSDRQAMAGSRRSIHASDREGKSP